MFDELKIDALKDEVEMLDNMITEVEGQFDQVSKNLEKLRAVREALKHVVDTNEQPVLDFYQGE
jgi:prefoldin subunit 5